MVNPSFPLKELYAIELALDFLPVMLAAQDRYVKAMKTVDPTWDLPAGVVRPRAQYLFDGGDEHMAALFSPDKESLTVTGQRMKDANIGCCKFSASRSKSQQPMDVSKFFCNLKRGVKTDKYYRADLDDLKNLLSAPQRAAFDKFLQLRIPAASKKTFSRFILNLPYLISDLHTLKVQQKSFSVAGN